LYLGCSMDAPISVIIILSKTLKVSTN